MHEGQTVQSLKARLRRDVELADSLQAVIATAEAKATADSEDVDAVYAKFLNDEQRLKLPNAKPTRESTMGSGGRLLVIVSLLIFIPVILIGKWLLHRLLNEPSPLQDRPPAEAVRH